MMQEQFRCNLCGSENVFCPIGDWREAPSCTKCASSVRTRHLVHCLTKKLLNRSSVIANLHEKHLIGIGLSDSENLSGRLVDAFEYVNTYYHTDPMLDICNPPNSWRGRADFVTASDVLEHVSAPVQRAFDGAYQLLKPGGVLVLTVPFDDRPITSEHFPNVRKFKTMELDGEWLLLGKTDEPSYEIHRNLIFHGGPGTTVEMRFFSRQAVVDHLREAGFGEIIVHDQNIPNYGIFLPHNQGLPITASKI